MSIRDVLADAREIWGPAPLSPAVFEADPQLRRKVLRDVLVRLLVGVGDLARVARGADKDGPVDVAELKKEMGNVIFSVIRWCDDLGLDPAECVQRAVEAQQKFAAQNRSR